MKKLIIACIVLLLLTGCGVGRHEGRIETFDANGSSTGTYIATLDRPMMIEVIDPNGVTVKADSRGNSTWGQFLSGMMEIVTLGLLVD